MPVLRKAQQREPFLAVRMTGIAHDETKRIAEDRRGLLEGDRVLCQICSGLSWVPLELQRQLHTMVARLNSRVKDHVGETATPQ